MTSKPIRVDILEMEMSKGLPRWLDPIARFKHTHCAAAQARRTFGQAEAGAGAAVASMAQAARLRQDRQHLYQWPKPLFPKCNRSADQTDLTSGDRDGAPPTDSPPRRGGPCLRELQKAGYDCSLNSVAGTLRRNEILGCETFHHSWWTQDQLQP